MFTWADDLILPLLPSRLHKLLPKHNCPHMFSLASLFFLFHILFSRSLKQVVLILECIFTVVMEHIISIMKLTTHHLNKLTMPFSNIFFFNIFKLHYKSQLIGIIGDLFNLTTKYLENVCTLIINNLISYSYY